MSEKSPQAETGLASEGPLGSMPPTSRTPPTAPTADHSASRLFVCGMILGVLIGMATLAGWITPIDPIAQDRAAPFFTPSRFHPMGTDALGRDVLARVLHAARPSLIVATLAASLAILLGFVVGYLAARSRGPADGLPKRSVNLLLAVPSLLLALAAATLCRADGTASLVLLLGLTTWMPVARLVRREVSAATQVATKVGLSLIVAATLQMGDLVLMESGLSFLGLGMAPPTPSWGGMIRQGIENIGNAWWAAIFPMLALAFAVNGFKMIGEGLRDALSRSIVLPVKERSAFLRADRN